jgi:hypothetical protein
MSSLWYREQQDRSRYLAPKGRTAELTGFQEKAEESSITKTQTGFTDIEEEEQKGQSYLNKPENQWPHQDGGCPECCIKVAQINNLESELRGQEERARQDKEAACMHEWTLANAHVDEVRKELSTRINELEAQQSGQTSTPEGPGAQPRSTHYDCDNCLYLQMKLMEAKRKGRELDDMCERRKYKIRGLEYRLDSAQDDSAILRVDLNAANEEIARLRAKLGLRTSKL